jgi:23S rRNA pseudouridine2605 synthase
MAELAAEGERLQKVLARAGFGSRRAAEELIAAGRVAVDDEIAHLGRRVDVNRNRITVDGIPVAVRTDLVYYLLNKPAKVVTTARDPEGRRTVLDLVPLEPRVFPVGRLDYETEGLLVLTNDGELAQLLSHPGHGVPKAYLAEVDGVPSRAAVRELREGIDLDDGRTAPAQVRLVQRHGDNAALELVIHEGRNRQVRRMCEAIGHPVRRLVRTRIGPVSDRQLAPGDWRPLRAREVRGLFEAAK